MINCVMYAKITDPEREKYMMIMLKSLEYLKPDFIIALQDPSDTFSHEVGEYLKGLGRHFYFARMYGNKNYGEVYSELLSECTHKYVLNCIEDHVSVMDSKEDFENILSDMDKTGAEVMRASFHTIELKSLSGVLPSRTDHGYYFRNNRENALKFGKAYDGGRYFAGINWLTTLEFAKKFWKRKFNSSRPHDWEIARYDPEFEHTVFLPRKEFLASVDDPHGEPDTHLLARHELKFWRLYES